MPMIEDIELFQALSPFIKVIRIFGLFHNNVNYRVENLNNDGSKMKRKWRGCPFSKCYSLALIIFMSCNNIRLLTTFSEQDTFGFILFWKIIFTLWYFNATFTLISNYVASTGAYEFFIEWNNK